MIGFFPDHFPSYAPVSDCTRQLIMSKFPKKPLQALMDLARVNKEKLVAPLPDNLTSKTVLKTEDARIDLHKNLATPDEVTARIQANTGAKTSSVKKWIREAKQKGHRERTRISAK